MNGHKIYDNDETTDPPRPLKDQGLEDYLLEQLTKSFEKLPDGDYYLIIRDLVADRNGRIVYYKFFGVEGEEAGSRYGDRISIFGFRDTPIDVPVRFVTAIKNRVDGLLRNTRLMKPARIDGKTVLSFCDFSPDNYMIEVRNHQVTIVNRTGEGNSC